MNNCDTDISGDCPNTPFGSGGPRSWRRAARLALPETAVAIMSQRIDGWRVGATKTVAATVPLGA